MEALELRKCANVKSKKHQDQVCSYSATHGDFCSRHYKNPQRFVNKQTMISEKILTRSGHTAVRLLQRVWRRWSVKRRFHCQGPAANCFTLASNETEIYSLENLDTIPKSFFFSFADENKIIWAFDIRSLSHLVN